MEEIEVLRVRISELGTFAFDPNSLDLNIGDRCVVEDSDGNEDLGQVVGRLKIPRRKFQRPLRKVLRIAAKEDSEIFKKRERMEIEAREICRGKIKDRELPMKLVRTRYSPNGKRITFYFTSEKRIDFRELVKDLAYIFKRRIELRQIGVRDEAKMCGGFGCCGRELCCSRFLKRLGRMSFKMAKEQDMTLTPSKISGVCGRLLCCLQYESEWYQDVKQALPQIGSTIKANDISGKVESLDLFHSVIKVRDDDGRLFGVEFEDFEKQSKIDSREKGRKRRSRAFSRKNT